MRTDDRERTMRIAHLKAEVTSPKSRLISLALRMREVSPHEADRLERIIARLEAWQRARA
jgi:hypothetical protein